MMVQRLGALAGVLLGDPGSVPSTHIDSSSVNLVPAVLVSALTSAGTRSAHGTHTRKENTHTHKISALPGAAC